ncbi:MAG TPA: pyruvate, phosphate dikinase [Archangium sp.]|uniref:pyruvate, phosphate dikinase n=1 Tax=Archangium sp. TaxID=1872627 RepID=UPI002E2F3488|nr:pyruvate, phosphate dikinase [Archangium sp.]HEX5750805.1 pyruvate, phosphate dikinase [Archangium sp.]
MPRRAQPGPRLARAPKSARVSKTARVSKRPRASKATREKWVYLFDEGRGDMKELLGGKGANLAEMTRIGLPVPPGFIVTTRACNAFLAAGSRFPEGLWEQALAALRKLEKRAGRTFGDPDNALLVSCRSGARFSMPGMMDTILNLGLNDAVVVGLAAETGDARFAYDAYRRLVQMFGTVVLDLPDEPFEHVLEEYRRQRGLENDAALPAEDLKAITQAFQRIIREKTGRDFPQEPIEQLRLATEAVFRSWNGKRAVDYRNAAGIAHDLGTAVNIVTMVFGNRGEGSGTGVVTTRNVSTGEPEMEGDYLSNAQGEDVVSGTRPTLRISALKELHPKLYAQLERYCGKLERHFRDVQDVEFTIEQGKLWMLQTRDAKRTAQAAVRIAVELAREKRISRQEAVLRVKPEQIDFFLHPQFAPSDKKAAKERGDLLATGLNVSPGAASGVVALDADTAERWSKEEKKAVIMVRPETKPDDVHGMLAAQGILTSRGGRTSHAALVARQFGKPAVVGVSAMEVDCEKRQLTIAGRVIREGELVSIDGTTGELFAGRLQTIIPDLKDAYILELLRWADGFREMGVYANADYPRDAERARELGAEGIGLCRTEHMFFETDRLPHVQRMILARSDAERDEALATLLPFQREDFLGLFRTMNGQPVTIRLIDPPLHEFLPNHDELLHDVTALETRLEFLKGKPEAKGLEERLAQKRRLLEAVESMREANPMLGLRGVRLGIHLPALVRMQVRAIFEAACQCTREGVRVFPKVMIPLIAHSNELRVEKELLETEARAVMKEQGVKVAYQFGTMIEIPRAALTADQIAQDAEFFSFGTNDLTQTTYGISRDDAETGFLSEYLQKRILPENPFATIDQRGVGALMEMAVKLGRGTRPKLNIGICGEHGGDPKTIAFCHRIGLDYVSCSPYRVPIARLAAAHAALKHET